MQQLRASARTAWLADESLPVFGVGHSNGALLHLLAGSLAPGLANHRGDVLISFNNRCFWPSAGKVFVAAAKCDSDVMFGTTPDLAKVPSYEIHIAMLQQHVVLDLQGGH